MNLQKMIDTLVAERTEQLIAEFDGNLTGFWDERDHVIRVHGKCKKVHPNLVDLYPNGWSLTTGETIAEVLEKLGYEIDLSKKTSSNVIMNNERGHGYRYEKEWEPLVSCPYCKRDLTGKEDPHNSQIEVAYTVDGITSRFETLLTDEGILIDSCDNVIFKGFHSETFCKCGKSLVEWEIAEQVLISTPQINIWEKK